MRIGQFLKTMGLVTLMAVLYIHLQMNIYALAYDGKEKEQKIEKLVENNILMKNDILRLQSSDHIGRELLAENKEYRFARASNVIEVEESEPWGGLFASNEDGGFFGRVMTLAFSGGKN